MAVQTTNPYFKILSVHTFIKSFHLVLPYSSVRVSCQISLFSIGKRNIMAEAVAAFSLAANVIQFIDFGARVASNFWRFYKFRENRASEIPDIRTITADLDMVLVRVQPVVETDDSESGLRQLVNECQDVAAGLQKVLRSLAKVRTDKSTKRDALKAAFKVVWKEEEIKAFQTRLDQFRAQLTVHLLSSLR